MEKKRLQPGFWRIVDNDYIATFSIYTIGTLWVVYLVFKVFALEFRDEQFYLILSVVLTVVGILVLAWRYWAIRLFFEKGERTRGKLIKSDFFRSTGWLEYEYTLKGKRYHKKETVHRNPRTRALKGGDLLWVVVDPQRPERAMVADIYEETPKK